MEKTSTIVSSELQPSIISPPVDQANNTSAEASELEYLYGLVSFVTNTASKIRLVEDTSKQFPVGFISAQLRVLESLLRDAEPSRIAIKIRDDSVLGQSPLGSLINASTSVIAIKFSFNPSSYANIKPTAMPNIVQTVSTALRNNASIRQLHLTGLVIDTTLAAALALTDLDTLRLSWCIIGDSIYELISSVRSLRSLTICRSAQGYLSVPRFVRALENLRNLVALDLNYCDIRGQESETLISAVSKIKTLTSLTLAYDIAFCHFLRPIRSLKRLTRLNIAGIAVDERETAATLDGLRMLQSLDLSSNKFDTVKMGVLAPAIGKLTLLRELHMVGCSIDPGGAKALGAVIGRLKRLEMLNISSNASMKYEGVVALSPGLRELESLVFLEIEDIGMGDIGAEALAEAIKPLEKLEKVDAQCNHIEKLGDKALRETARERRFPIAIYDGWTDYSYWRSYNGHDMLHIDY